MPIPLGTLAASGSAPQAVVTGGTVTTSGGFTYHTFTSSGTLSISQGALTNADYLIVGGGGGNGTNGAYFPGGGGAGRGEPVAQQHLYAGKRPGLCALV